MIKIVKTLYKLPKGLIRFGLLYEMKIFIVHANWKSYLTFENVTLSGTIPQIIHKTSLTWMATMDLACSWNIDLTGWLRYFFKSWGVRSATTLWPFWAFEECLVLFGLKSGLGGDADMAKVYSRHCPAAHGSWKQKKFVYNFSCLFAK